MSDQPNDLSAGRLSAGIGSLLEDSAPPSTMDGALALTRGRAIKRRRRGAAVGSGLVVTAVAGALVAAALPAPGRPLGIQGGLGASASASAHASTSTSTPVPSPTTGTPLPPPAPTSGYAVPSGTDPIVSSVSFGWLPAGVQANGLDWESGTFSVQSTTLMAGANNMFSLSVLPAGESPSSSWDNGTTSRAPDVNGHTAYWAGGAPGSSAAAGSGQLILEWEYASDSWAALTAQIGDTSDTGAATVYRVAENVKYGLHIVTAAPFRLAQAPAGIPLAGAGYLPFSDAVSSSGRGVDLEYAYTTGSGPATDLESLLIDVNVDAGAAPAAGRHITVDGYKASLQTTATTAELIVFDDDGLDVAIDVHGARALADVDAVGGIVAYFQHTLTLFGPNQANWTTDVVG